jgi:GNAT superfamily N-acetyltransferase
MPVQVVRRADPPAVAGLLASVPEWFGIAGANAQYVADAGRLPSYLAVDGDEVVGVALLAEHFPESRELHLLAVRRDRHREGIGRALVEAVASDLGEAGVRLLEVHTVGPSHEDEGYARTREFYRALGFVAMNELQRIDWSGPTLILVRPL